jgi:hypothetical protein
MAERQGFEPWGAVKPLHDFQSCPLDQLGHLSILKLKNTCKVTADEVITGFSTRIILYQKYRVIAIVI